MAPAAPPTQLSRPRAVTVFAVNWDGMQEQKPRQPCGRESSFSSNALGEMFRHACQKEKRPLIGL